jgi:hypothetical protein
VGKRRSDQAFNGRFFFGQPTFNEMALKICKRSLKQRSISRDVIAMRVQTGDLLINQRRLSVRMQNRYHMLGIFDAKALSLAMSRSDKDRMLSRRNVLPQHSFKLRIKTYFKSIKLR